VLDCTTATVKRCKICFIRQIIPNVDNTFTEEIMSNAYTRTLFVQFKQSHKKIFLRFLNCELDLTRCFKLLLFIVITDNQACCSVCLSWSCFATVGLSGGDKHLTLSWDGNPIPHPLTLSTSSIASPSFYRAMHYSVKRGFEITCRLSVRPSVRPSVCLSMSRN